MLRCKWLPGSRRSKDSGSVTGRVSNGYTSRLSLLPDSSPTDAVTVTWVSEPDGGNGGGTERPIAPRLFSELKDQGSCRALVRPLEILGDVP